MYKFLLLFCLVSANIALAQDSTRVEKKGVISVFRQKLNRTQSVSATEFVDSLKAKLISKTDTRKLRQPDSLQTSIESDPLLKFSLEGKAKQVEDSIKWLASYRPEPESTRLRS
jgi:hypothetical protein